MIAASSRHPAALRHSARPTRVQSHGGGEAGCYSQAAATFARLRLRARRRALEASDIFPAIRDTSAGRDPPAFAAASLPTRECCMDRESRATASHGHSVGTSREGGGETTDASWAPAESRAIFVGVYWGWLPF